MLATRRITKIEADLGCKKSIKFSKFPIAFTQSLLNLMGTPFLQAFSEQPPSKSTDAMVGTSFSKAMVRLLQTPSPNAAELLSSTPFGSFL